MLKTCESYSEIYRNLRIRLHDKKENHLSYDKSIENIICGALFLDGYLQRERYSSYSLLKHLPKNYSKEHILDVLSNHTLRERVYHHLLEQRITTSFTISMFLNSLDAKIYQPMKWTSRDLLLNRVKSALEWHASMRNLTRHKQRGIKEIAYKLVT